MHAPSVEVSVTEPLMPAWDRAKRLLFQPFSFQRWLLVGVGAWLANLGRGGIGTGANLNLGRDPDSMRRQFETGKDYVLSNLHWVVPLAAAGLLLLLALWVAMVWLSSRGRFMFLHCVAGNRAEVVAPWHHYAAPAHSLFVFRLVAGVLAFLAELPLLAVGGVLVGTMIASGEPNLLAITGALVTFLGAVAVGVAFVVGFKITHDFVVPLMLLRHTTCLNAWQEFLRLLALNKGNFTLYLLFQIVIHLVLGVVVLVAVVATCCLAGCLLALPYVGTVAMLPLLVFARAYSLLYLAQYGPAYDVFAAPTSSGAPA